MLATEKDIKPIITHLKELQGNDPYISGKCKLVSLGFNEIFIKAPSEFRLVMLLKPDNSASSLILILDGKEINGGKRWLSPDGKTVCFWNAPHAMFILRTDELSSKDLNDILSVSIAHKVILPSIFKKRAEDEFFTGAGSNPLCDVIIGAGYIPLGVGKIEFTATFLHEYAKGGTFTLMIEK